MPQMVWALGDAGTLIEQRPLHGSAQSAALAQLIGTGKFCDGQSTA